VTREQILLSPEELAGREDTLVFDVTVNLASPRHDGDYRSESGRPGWLRQHIPGARHVDLRTDFVDPALSFHYGHPSPASVRAELGRLGVSSGTEIALYDNGRMQWATRAWWMLRDAGIAARVLDGGLPAWAAAGFRLDSGEVPARPAVAAPTPTIPEESIAQGSLWVSKEEVRAISEGERDGTLVCALSPAHFAGAVPTRYSRRGHIPRSQNLPASSFLTEDHSFVSPARTVELAAGELASATEPVVVYCGGGISATVVALGLTLAGHRLVRVYDGSLEEWTADPDLPVTSSEPV
jgi:thiosulfate/3-mercaptopyruvate sulfurtransferase